MTDVDRRHNEKVLARLKRSQAAGFKSSIETRKLAAIVSPSHTGRQVRKKGVRKKVYLKC